MFSGIIETIGKVVHLKREQANLHISIQADFTDQLKVDQSIAHNGVCLTVVAIVNNVYTVTAIDETLQKTNLGSLQLNDSVNLERCVKVGGRLDGHIVQGHVDGTGICNNKQEKDGSVEFTFQYDQSFAPLIIEKGSICVNGVSLTAFNVTENNFTVAIIPYTFEHTNFYLLKTMDFVNLEFDILGKYVARIMALKSQ